MAWIESHQTLREHPKVYVLVDALGVSKAQILGHLHLIWWWCVDYAPDGVISQNDVTVARAGEWTGDPKQFVTALVTAGFIDRVDDVLVVHDWGEYRLHYDLVRERQSRQKEQTRERVRLFREKKRNSNAPVTPSNAPTKHNQTKHNQTKDKAPPLAGPIQGQNGETSTSQVRPNGSTPRALTDVQKLVLGFKAVMGVDPEDKGWDAVYFRRYSKPASELLKLFGGEGPKAADCIDAVVQALEKRGLSWTPETVVKHAGDWKNGRLFK